MDSARVTMATLQCGEFIVAVRCGSTSASTAARTSTRRVVRVRRRTPPSEAVVDSSSRALHGNGQREKAKWQAYRGSVAALLRNDHEDTSVEMSRCGNGVTAADCEALFDRNGDRVRKITCWRYNLEVK